MAKSVHFPTGCFNCYPMTMLAGSVTEHSLDHERVSAYSCPPDLAGEGPSCHLQPDFGSEAHRMRRPGSSVPPKAILQLGTDAVTEKEVFFSSAAPGLKVSEGGDSSPFFI